MVDIREMLRKWIDEVNLKFHLSLIKLKFK